MDATLSCHSTSVKYWIVSRNDADTWVSAVAALGLTVELNQAGGISVFVVAASAVGSRVGWVQGEFLWAPTSLLCAPVPVEEGTA